MKTERRLLDKDVVEFRRSVAELAEREATLGRDRAEFETRNAALQESEAAHASDVQGLRARETK